MISDTTAVTMAVILAVRVPEERTDFSNRQGEGERGQVPDACLIGWLISLG